MASFPACDGVMLRRGQVQCVFTEDSANRLGDRQQSGPTRCIKHGNIICDYIYATDLEAAKKIAKERAK